MECKWFQICPMKILYEKGKLDKIWVDRYCKGNWQKCIRFKMEENGEYHSDLMLPDGSIMGNLKK